MTAFRVKLGANDLNCVDVPLNPTHVLMSRCLVEELIRPVLVSEFCELSEHECLQAGCLPVAQQRASKQ